MSVYPISSKCNFLWKEKGLQLRSSHHCRKLFVTFFRPNQKNSRDLGLDKMSRNLSIFASHELFLDFQRNFLSCLTQRQWVNNFFRAFQSNVKKSLFSPKVHFRDSMDKSSLHASNLCIAKKHFLKLK